MEGESQQHEEGDGLVGGAPLQEDLRLELVEYLMEDLFGDAEGGGAEEDPAGCYELDISNPQDEIVALAVVLTIDCVMASQSSVSTSASN